MDERWPGAHVRHKSFTILQITFAFIRTSRLALYEACVAIAGDIVHEKTAFMNTRFFFSRSTRLREERQQIDRSLARVPVFYKYFYLYSYVSSFLLCFLALYLYFSYFSFIDVLYIYRRELELLESKGFKCTVQTLLLSD